MGDLKAVSVEAVGLPARRAFFLFYTTDILIVTTNFILDKIKISHVKTHYPFRSA